MNNDDDKDALEAAKKARWETGEWCGDSVEQFEAGWYAHHDMTKGRTTCPTCLGTGEKPALKCPNSDCLDGYLQEFSAEGLRVKGNPCPTCHGEKP
jgi:hypothetical protein